MKNNLIIPALSLQKNRFLSSKIPLWVQNSTNNILKFNPKDLFFLIEKLKDTTCISNNDEGKVKEIQDTTFQMYHYIFSHWSKQYSNDFELYEKSLRHFLGTLAQRVVFYSVDYESHTQEIIRIFQFYLSLSQEHTLTLFFLWSQKQFDNECFDTEYWLQECESYLGI